MVFGYGLLRRCALWGSVESSRGIHHTTGIPTPLFNMALLSNDDDNDAPPSLGIVVLLLVTFTSVFLVGYYQTVLSPSTGSPNGFGTSINISNLHSVPLVFMASLSLYNDTLPEIYPLCWSVSFFIVDLLDCIVRREGMWMAHAVISLILNVLTGWNAQHRILRSVSKGFFAEASTVSWSLFFHVSFFVNQLLRVCVSLSLSLLFLQFVQRLRVFFIPG